MVEDKELEKREARKEWLDKFGRTEGDVMNSIVSDAEYILVEDDNGEVFADIAHMVFLPDNLQNA